MPSFVSARVALVALIAVSCKPAAPVTPAPVPAAAPAPEKPAPATNDRNFKPFPDTTADDATLPASTVRVTIDDADNAPISRATVTLETVLLRDHSSAPEVVATDSGVTGEEGTVVFRVASLEPRRRYIVKSKRGDGTFSVEPFVLGASAGKRVVLHTYETVSSIERALVLTESIAYLAVRADAIDVEELHRFHNIGRTAWVPANVRVVFPPNVHDFLAGDLGMPIRADDITAEGFLLVGTLAPGQQELEYRYKIPRDPSGSQTVTLHMPPRNARMRVILEADGAATLKVAGLPEAEKNSSNGAPVLMTENKLEPGHAFQDVEISFSGTPRPER